MGNWPGIVKLLLWIVMYGPSDGLILVFGGYVLVKLGKYQVVQKF